MIKDSITSILKTLRNNKALQITTVLIIVAVGLVIMFRFDLPETQAFIRANRSQAALISVGIYFLLSFTFIPASPLTLFLSVFLGPIETVAFATVGNTLAALLQYQIGAKAGDIIDFESKMEKLPFKLGKLPITSPLVLMAGRLMPLGKNGFSIVCGAYQVPIGKYIWTTILMFAITASVLAFTGASLLKLIQTILV